jgi:hypothetical protein
MTNGACAVGDYAYDAALANAGVTGIDVFKAIIMGEDYFGYAVGLPVELRDGGVVDFGREHSLAWYAIWGSGILHPERAVVVETA